jgi:Ca-activated chloride channel family protein
MAKRLCALAFLLFASLTFLAGCSAGDMGATAGGAQDNALADEKIAQGGVPKSADITVEGVLNRHDLPLATPPCEGELCISAAYGVAPTLERSRSAVFVQMGLSSGIDPATFRRAPLNLSVVVDRSGSMAGSKIMAVRAALSRLIDQLGPTDRLSIVLFDDRVDVLLPSTLVTDREKVRALLEGVVERGATDMAAGLRAGYEQVAAHAGAAGVSDRVMILTDAQTNTGDTATSTFVELAGRYGAQGIGLTVFGLGTDLNQQLVLAISNLRGGSYYFLEDSDKIATVFDSDFDYLVTPLAYDLRLLLQPADGLRLNTVYGHPAWKSGTSSVEVYVATVFLSRKYGAIVARLEPAGLWPDGAPPVAELTLAYTTPDGRSVSGAMHVAYGGPALGDQTIFYSERGVRKTVALVNAALGMRTACDLYWRGQRDAAHSLLARTRDLVLSEGHALGDYDLSEEAATVQELDSNMSRTRSDDHRYDYACAFTNGASRPATGWFFALALASLRARPRCKEQSELRA